MNAMMRRIGTDPTPRHPARARLGWGIAAAMLLASARVYAGAWTLPEGTGQAILSTAATSNDHYFADDGAPFSGQMYKKEETTLSIDYGLTDSLTATFAPGLLATSVGGSAGGHYFGADYTALGLRQRVYTDGTNVFSVAASARLPGAGNARNPAEIGYTGLEYDVRGLYGRNFMLGSWPAFADAEIGYLFRNGAPPGEYHIDLTVGARPASRWLLMLQSFSVISNGAGTGVFNTSYSYYKIQPSVVYDFSKHWSVQLGLVATVAGRNSWREQGANAALWYRF